MQDLTGVKTIRHEMFDGVLVQALKEALDRITELEKKVEALS